MSISSQHTSSGIEEQCMDTTTLLKIVCGGSKKATVNVLGEFNEFVGL